eukprot:TRINITY_DN22990_c0_g2_i1.p1 TRINITY_DN22990_c0_g2~~TRINITY_DN22990_c0_g2_i1.p1  ORF type:complete len:195 (+),score=51.82 TRINITY_DN22990_c0_g2_i1:115-699(+)
MFSCRMCSDNPFTAGLFGGGTDKNDKAKDKRSKEVRKKGDSGTSTARRSRSNASRRDEAAFRPRSAAAVKETVAEWKQYAHPRAREFFQDNSQLDEVLTALALGIDRDEDPILGPEDRCVFWYGDVTKEDLQAAIRMVKPGESAESVTYVNRILAFIFATDESFTELMKLPKEPFKMSCEDQLCVHLGHISLST